MMKLFVVALMALQMIVDAPRQLIIVIGPAKSLPPVVQAASCSRADVAAAHTTAQTGSTVIVPSGSCTWDTTLTITKRITLQGAGVGVTTITGNMGSSAYILSYIPTDALSGSVFRLTGFTLDSNENSRLISVSRNTTAGPTYIRLDNNHFIAADGFVPAAEFQGVIYGVIDNNTFDGAMHIDNYGLQVNTWTALAYAPGSADNLYYEDNTFNICFTGDTGGHGGRYAKRYNTYNLQNPDLCFASLSGFFPLWDAHGNQASGVYTNMGVEVYGNLVNSVYNVSPWLDQRGGKALMFFNKLVGEDTVTIRIREEHDDSISAPATNLTDGTPQHPNNSYYFNNRGSVAGTTLIAAVEGEDCCAAIAENVSWWNHQTSFDGTVGMGCGTVAARPATCTTGVAYWATAQSCSTVDAAQVGRAPSSPISGTLYKCTSTNTWTSLYTPYTYPHPFRAGS